MAAMRDGRAQGRAFYGAFLLYALAVAGFFALILWRLWTEVLAGLLT